MRRKIGQNQEMDKEIPQRGSLWLAQLANLKSSYKRKTAEGRTIFALSRTPEKGEANTVTSDRFPKRKKVKLNYIRR
jgi:hypothetical protein